MRPCPLALGEQRRGEVVERALAAMTPGALAARAILGRAPAAHLGAPAARTWQRPVLPPERMEVGWALFGVAEGGHMRESRHGGASPGVVKRVLNGWDILTCS